MKMALSNAGTLAAKKFSRYMEDLHVDRRKADYELALRFNFEKGRSAFNLAHRAIAAFDVIDKTALSEGVSNYLRQTNQI